MVTEGESGRRGASARHTHLSQPPDAQQAALQLALCGLACQCCSIHLQALDLVVTLLRGEGRDGGHGRRADAAADELNQQVASAALQLLPAARRRLCRPRCAEGPRRPPLLLQAAATAQAAVKPVREAPGMII